MLHLFINGLAASAGGGLTYMRNVIPHLSATAGVVSTIALQPDFAREFTSSPRITLLPLKTPTGAARRFWYEQKFIPDAIQRSGAHVLVSAGNFALRRSPVPQILLSRNSLYISQDFYRDLRKRREHRMWADTWIKGILAKRSIRWADRTIVPTRAFAEDVSRWASGNVGVIHHGFDQEAFCRDNAPLPVALTKKLEEYRNSLKLLFVSHYTYYRNFETLIRALPLIRDGLRPRDVCLVLTCELRNGRNPGTYRTGKAAALIRDLHLDSAIVELGAVPYNVLWNLYCACDVYVTPAYAETFAHPLVEAMSSRIPVVASDIPVHREVCGTAALYFSRFSRRELADRVMELAAAPEAAARMVVQGAERVQHFSWREHVDQIVTMADQLRRHKAGAK